MSWSLQAGGHGNIGSATVYAPYKDAKYLNSLPLDELASEIVAYLKQANQEAEEREAVVPEGLPAYTSSPSYPVGEEPTE